LPAFFACAIIASISGATLFVSFAIIICFYRYEYFIP
jgi:hypothetical protein